MLQCWLWFSMGRFTKVGPWSNFGGNGGGGESPASQAWLPALALAYLVPNFLLTGSPMPPRPLAIMVASARQSLLGGAGSWSSGQKDYTPNLTKMKMCWKMPLKLIWKVPAEIHWTSDNPLEIQLTSEIMLEDATGNLKIPLKIHDNF